MQTHDSNLRPSVRGFLLTRLRQMAGEGGADTPPCPMPPSGEVDTPHITPHITGGIPAGLTPHIPALYREWRNDLLAGRKVLPARDGRLWLHRRVRLRQRLEISAPAIDKLLRAFKRRAFNDGLLLLNPHYTGKPPFPQYIRVGG